MGLALDIVNVVLIGCAVVVVAGFVIWTVVGLMAFAAWLRDRLPERYRLEYERYLAEHQIRSIRRQAVHDMFEAEQSQRLARDDLDVIEGTAVEVHPR
jgi:hypothetical protein